MIVNYKSITQSFKSIYQYNCLINKPTYEIIEALYWISLPHASNNKNSDYNLVLLNLIMSKKKSRKRVIKVFEPKLSTVFDCPFCNHKQSVEVKM